MNITFLISILMLLTTNSCSKSKSNPPTPVIDDIGSIIGSCSYSGSSYKRIKCSESIFSKSTDYSKEFLRESSADICASKEGTWQDETACTKENNLVKCLATIPTDILDEWHFFEPYFSNYLVESGACKEKVLDLEDLEYDIDSWDLDISEQNLTGSINSISINTYKMRADVNSFDNTFLDVELYFNTAEDIDPCAYIASQNNEITASGKLPNEIGTHYLRQSFADIDRPDDFSLTLNMLNGASPFAVITDAIKVVIEEKTETTLTGKLKAMAEGGNFLDGNFEATICP